MNTLPMDTDTLREYVRTRYGAIAEQAGTDCGCGPTCCTAEQPQREAKASSPKSCCDTDGQCNASYGEKLGYTAEELAAIPAGADLGLGCGNPLAVASIRPGEVVLDLGSGAGFDCFLAARQLSGTGRVIGVDEGARVVCGHVSPGLFRLWIRRRCGVAWCAGGNFSDGDCLGSRDCNGDPRLGSVERRALETRR